MTLRQAQDERLVDAGFADPQAVHAFVRRLKLRSALNDAQASIAALLDLLDEGFEPEEGVGASGAEQGVGLCEGDVEGGLGGGAVEGVDSKDVREKELLDGVNVVLEFLDAVGVSLRHGLFSLAGAQEAKQPGSDGHSLSGRGK